MRALLILVPLLYGLTMSGCTMYDKVASRIGGLVPSFPKRDARQEAMVSPDEGMTVSKQQDAENGGCKGGFQTPLLPPARQARNLTNHYYLPSVLYSEKSGYQQAGLLTRQAETAPTRNLPAQTIQAELQGQAVVICFRSCLQRRYRGATLLGCPLPFSAFPSVWTGKTPTSCERTTLE